MCMLIRKMQIAVDKMYHPPLMVKEEKLENGETLHHYKLIKKDEKTPKFIFCCSPKPNVKKLDEKTKKEIILNARRLGGGSTNYFMDKIFEGTDFNWREEILRDLNNK